MSLTRILLVGLVAAQTSPTLAFAADAKEAKAAKLACVTASDKAQSLRTDGKLVDAREQLLICAREICPGPVRKDCTRRLGELEDALPSIVIAGKDSGGKDVIDVRVTIDGVVVLEKLDGKALSVDPGAHAFKFEHGKEPPVVEQVLVHEGVKNRMLTVTFPVTAPPPRPEDRKPTVPLATWILGGVGVVGLGSFAFFGLGARSRAEELRTTCAPTCAGSDVDSLKTRMRVADISLGVGVLALGGATVFFMLARRGNDDHASTGIQVGVTPWQNGGGIVLQGVFR